MDRISDPTVERYFDRLRVSMRGMPAADIDEILLELRTHIEERSESMGSSEEALRSLGNPEELARQYRTEQVAERAVCGGSPLVILHSLFLLRRRSVAGWIAVGIVALAYAWALAFGAASIEKIFSPHDVGLWRGSSPWSLPRLTVDGPGPPGTHEMLGWWMVPFGLAVCAVLLFVTNKAGLWWIRRSRARR